MQKQDGFVFSLFVYHITVHHVQYHIYYSILFVLSLKDSTEHGYLWCKQEKINDCDRPTDGRIKSNYKGRVFTIFARNRKHRYYRRGTPGVLVEMKTNRGVGYGKCGRVQWFFPILKMPNAYA